jgi:hypothetical protein
LFTNLFLIMFRPQRTLDRLIEERKYGQSWAATFTLIGLNALLMFLFGVYISRTFRGLMEMIPSGVMEPGEAEIMSWMMIGFFVVGILFSAVGIILSRFFFGWFVQLGLWIVAARKMRETENRAEKARLLRLVQPYTMGILMIPWAFLSFVVPLFFDLPTLFEAMVNDELQDNDELTAELLPSFTGIMIWSLLSNLVQLGLIVYQVIVRVIAIRKIYDNVSVAQAFFGPFIVYALVYLLVAVAYIAFIALLAVIGHADPVVTPTMRL